MFKWIKNLWENHKRKKARNRRIAELKKKDPFIYD
jgi:hypothetical protein